MKKIDLIRTLAAETSLTQADIERTLVSLAQIITTELMAEGESSLPGLVKFKRTERKARKGRNPSTGEAMDIAAKIVIKAKVLHPLNLLP